MLMNRSMSYEEEIRNLVNDIKSLVELKKAAQRENDYSTFPSFTFHDASINFVKSIEEINKDQSTRNNKLMEVTIEHPEVRLIDKGIEEQKIRLAKDIDNAIVRLRTRQTRLTEAYNRYMAELINEPDKSRKFARLDKLAAMKNDFVMNLYDEKSSYMIASAGIVSDYIILQKASVAGTPISPKETFVKLAGVLVGLVLGLVVIIIRYLLQNTIIAIDDVERKSKAPLLGVIPRYKIS